MPPMLPMVSCNVPPGFQSHLYYQWFFAICHRASDPIYITNGFLHPWTRELQPCGMFLNNLASVCIGSLHSSKFCCCYTSGCCKSSFHSTFQSILLLLHQWLLQVLYFHKIMIKMYFGLRTQKCQPLRLKPPRE